MIYMDTASTSKYQSKDDIIVNTMVTAMMDNWMNPSSLYATNVKDKIDKCRTNIAEFIGAKTEEIIFTSGASESNNMAIRGWVEQKNCELNEKYHDVLKYYDLTLPVVLVSEIEHKSILDLLCKGNIMTIRHPLYVGKDGMLSLNYLEDKLKTYEFSNTPILVTVCMANNEIGTIQPIKKISELVHKYGGVLHVDATQVLGHIPIDVEYLGIDMMSCSGHKISPVLRGIGFLYKRNGINIKPLIYGTQENRLRGGTENTYGIIGLSKALEYCDVSITTMKRLRRKRDYFIERLECEFNCTLNGHAIDRLPNNVNVIFPQNITGESLLYMLDVSGIKCSVGSACNSKSIEPSHVLTAIGLNNEQAMRSVRFTLAYDVTYEQIDKVIEEIGKCLKLIETES